MTHWWQKGIVYQIYPRSFQDTNGDGIGDLHGIIQRLGYLHWLGIDAIWISPMYPSPMADFGYDISDYTDVHPMFGTLADMDELITAAHQRNIKVLLDFVPGHTSNQHPWFLESRSSRDNPKHDWYIWRDPAPDGGPPNNWLSRFDGKSGWTWDKNREQYYLHSFLAEQPDLNWRNPQVRETMLNVMRFWLDRGLDGFRVDVVYRVMKDPQLRDNPPNPDWREGMDPGHRLIEKYNKNTPDAHEFNRWLRAVTDEYDGRVLIGEINLPLPALVKHHGQNDEIHLPQNINLHDTTWEAEKIRALVEQYEALLPEGAWPNWVLGNHDQHRVATRIGQDQARVAMMLLLTLRGTPINYYGDELGMHDVAIPPEKIQDPWEIYSPGLGLGRDPERTPMQWDDTPNAGFCPPDVEPWLPVADDYAQNNVALARSRPDSMLTFTQKLIGLRRAAPALHIGEYRSLSAPLGLFAYLRAYGAERYVVVLNFTNREQVWPIPDEIGRLEIGLTTHLPNDKEIEGQQLSLHQNEGVVLKVAEA